MERIDTLSLMAAIIFSTRNCTEDNAVKLAFRIEEFVAKRVTQQYQERERQMQQQQMEQHKKLYGDNPA